MLTYAHYLIFRDWIYVGGACVNLFSNRLCREFTMSTGGTRQRRKGHGGSAVCMAIVASQKQQLTAAILFSESSVSTFDIKFEEEDAELGPKCDADFETLLGAHTAATAMMMKDESSSEAEEDEPERRSRRGKHGTMNCMRSRRALICTLGRSQTGTHTHTHPHTSVQCF